MRAMDRRRRTIACESWLRSPVPQRDWIGRRRLLASAPATSCRRLRRHRRRLRRRRRPRESIVLSSQTSWLARGHAAPRAVGGALARAGAAAARLALKVRAHFALILRSRSLLHAPLPRQVAKSQRARTFHHLQAPRQCAARRAPSTAAAAAAPTECLAARRRERRLARRPLRAAQATMDCLAKWTSAGRLSGPPQPRTSLQQATRHPSPWARHDRAPTMYRSARARSQRVWWTPSQCQRASTQRLAPATSRTRQAVAPPSAACCAATRAHRHA